MEFKLQDSEQMFTLYHTSAYQVLIKYVVCA
jgi:hypothetical protein